MCPRAGRHNLVLPSTRPGRRPAVGPDRARPVNRVVAHAAPGADGTTATVWVCHSRNWACTSAAENLGTGDRPPRTGPGPPRGNGSPPNVLAPVGPGDREATGHPEIHVGHRLPQHGRVVGGAGQRIDERRRASGQGACRAGEPRGHVRRRSGVGPGRYERQEHHDREHPAPGDCAPASEAALGDRLVRPRPAVRRAGARRRARNR